MSHLTKSFNLLQKTIKRGGHVLGGDHYSSLILDTLFSMDFVPVFLTIITRGLIRQERNDILFIKPECNMLNVNNSLLGIWLLFIVPRC